MPQRNNESSDWKKVAYRVFVTGLFAGVVAGSAHLFVINYLKKRAEK